MMYNVYNDKIRSIGKILIDEYKNNHIIHCGINGPYDDSETEVRNLCHLIIITAIEYKISHNKQHYDLLKKMGNELTNMKNTDNTYIMRNKNGKDVCNGVIGHSWVIEALIYLYRILDNCEFIILAKAITEKHTFCQQLSLWTSPSKNIDYTFNHQLWYAASLAELNNIINDKKIAKQLDNYYNNLSSICLNSMNGKVTHSIYKRDNIKGILKGEIKKIINLSEEFLCRKSMKYKEEGYHLFNMMAFARLYRINPNLQIFKSRFFSKAVKYINSEKILSDLEDKKYKLDKSLNINFNDESETEINVYGYPYNVPGFEIMYIAKVLNNKINPQIVNKLIENQFIFTYDDEKNYFGKRCHDKWTINYRIYEYYKYLELMK